jgi:hypothetical protein
MSHHFRIYFLVAALLIFSAGCGAPVISTPDMGLLNTAIAQTVAVRLTQNTPLSLSTPTLGSPTATFTATLTLVPPTDTLTPTITDTPTQTITPLPSITPTLSIPQISVSVPTNCRIGPGKVYPNVGYFLVGKTAQVFGRDPTNNYWYIHNPDNNAQFCWVWGQYATLAGPISDLPVFTPPPTPTATITPTPSPSFSADYASLDSCASEWWEKIKIKNTGSIAFQSINISVKDKDTGVIRLNLADGFTNRAGCVTPPPVDVIGAGDTYFVSTPSFSYDPTGHNLQVIITLCSSTGQKGLCDTSKINFKP